MLLHVLTVKGHGVPQASERSGHLSHAAGVRESGPGRATSCRSSEAARRPTPIAVSTRFYELMQRRSRRSRS